MSRLSGTARVVLAAAVLAGSAAVAGFGVGPVPPLGPLLDPAAGLWAGGRTPAGRTGATAVPGLAGEVRVVFDTRGVPHIFAAREEDAYRALGYVVARDRLFQLHLNALAASGRLTEFAGPGALALDRETRGLGLPRAAEVKLAAMDPASRRVLAAYADGVNAYAAAVGGAELPVEYKLTGRRPMRWAPAQSVHMMNRMGYTLALLTREDDRAAAGARVGRAAAAALFPAREPVVEPIQPNGAGGPRFDFAPLPPPGAPDPAAARVASARRTFFAPARPAASPDEGAHLASNNWAVAPARTGGGRALLAGDPHLELTLPSIWYEVHLVVPGALDVYGVTIPGIPGVVIGFNRDVAWTFTNTGVDVADYYAETVDDGARPARYRLDGAWRPLERRVETYRGTNGAVVATDTLYFTHRGPMRRDPGAGGAPPRWTSLRWTVLEPGDALAAFRDAARATGARDFLDRVARGYAAPAQNMLAADRGGTIAIRSTGRFPVRPDSLGGDVVRDGSTSASDWRGDLPLARYPQAFDPPQGFLASANQQPIDPRATADYWGGSYDRWRALRINALLRADARVTPDAMRRYQADPGSARADYFAPYFLRAAARYAPPGAEPNPAPATAPNAPPPGVDPRALAEAARLLGQWDRRYDTANTRAVLFEWALSLAAGAAWDELRVPGDRPAEGSDPFGAPTRRPALAAAPSSGVLAALFADSAGAWWDVRATAGRRETRDEVLAAALAAALDSCRAKYGAPDAGGWRWGRRRHANIRHLARLPAFSRPGLPVPGGPNTLWPSSGDGTAGPSWRMVVELGPEVRAWGIYPGGQSGDPLSPGYDDRLAAWRAGRLDALRVPRDPAGLGRDARATLTLRPAPR